MLGPAVRRWQSLGLRADEAGPFVNIRNFYLLHCVLSEKRVRVAYASFVHMGGAL